MAVKTIILPAFLALFALANTAHQPDNKPENSGGRRGEVASSGDMRPERWDVRLAVREERGTRDAREFRSNRLMRSV